MTKRKSGRDTDREPEGSTGRRCEGALQGPEEVPLVCLKGGDGVGENPDFLRNFRALLQQKESPAAWDGGTGDAGGKPIRIRSEP